MKKFTNRIFKISGIVSILLMLYSCLDDNVTPPITGELNSTAELLVYFESLGDFANSELAPALVEAEEVYANIGNYFIIDVRDNSDFIAGHIEGAVNVASDSLYSYMESITPQNYQKIILVSKNGHASAYYNCLLRLSGFNNLYSLNFGMASWHLDFADEWLNGMQNSLVRDSFNNDFYPKGAFTNLPDIIYENPDAPIQERAAKRIESMIKTGFNNSKEYSSRFNLFSDELLVCYGKSRLYNSPKFAPVDPEKGHAAGTIHYTDIPVFEFRTVRYLQTLPTHKSILIYDYNGQLSACMVAYLRALGYDALSLEFGANQVFYDRMLSDPELSTYAFDQTDIKNFSYVSGN
jgi:rhodanese-related sulfurtransferase